MCIVLLECHSLLNLILIHTSELYHTLDIRGKLLMCYRQGIEGFLPVQNEAEDFKTLVSTQQTTRVDAYEPLEAYYVHEQDPSLFQRFPFDETLFVARADETEVLVNGGGFSKQEDTQMFMMFSSGGMPTDWDALEHPVFVSKEGIPRSGKELMDRWALLSKMDSQIWGQRSTRVGPYGNLVDKKAYEEALAARSQEVSLNASQEEICLECGYEDDPDVTSENISLYCDFCTHVVHLGCAGLEKVWVLLNCLLFFCLCFYLLILFIQLNNKITGSQRRVHLLQMRIHRRTISRPH